MKENFNKEVKEKKLTEFEKLCSALVGTGEKVFNGFEKVLNDEKRQKKYKAANIYLIISGPKKIVGIKPEPVECTEELKFIIKSSLVEVRHYYKLINSNEVRRLHDLIILEGKGLLVRHEDKEKYQFDYIENQIKKIRKVEKNNKNEVKTR